MIHSSLPLAGTVGLLLLSVYGTAQAQFRFEYFGGQTEQGRSKDQRPGCACGPLGAVVSPTSITAKAGTSVSLRFDTSRICYGQTVIDMAGKSLGPGGGIAGTMTWENGAVQDLPDTWGVATYVPGYAQAGAYSLQLTVNVQCTDSGSKGCTRACSSTAKVPVTVTP